MSTSRNDLRELLEYNAKYRVLICRVCQYAIQKNALGSHLLRHNIYRGEREGLLASIAELDLLEPHLVSLPRPTSPPINALSIIPGYRCTMISCGYLCASTKHMRRHWSETHSTGQPLLSAPAPSCPVTLQTFFRGTKIMYFEVTSPKTTPLQGRKEPGNEGLHAVSLDPSTQQSSLISAESMRLPSGIALKSSLVDFDLQTLTYFHHFITSTSLTLPDTEHAKPVTPYWQTDFVLQALRIRWLMCGLMAISASHMATLVDDALMKTTHHEHSVQFLSKFSTTWDEITMNGASSSGVEIEEEEKRLGRQLLSHLRCAYWSFAERSPNINTVVESVAPFEIQAFITNIRGLLVHEFTFRSNATRVDYDDEGEMFAQVKQILETRSRLDFELLGDQSSADKASSTSGAVLDLLGQLPSRMADGFTKPQNGPDFLATMSAIAALIKCCNISFSSEDVGAAWWGMATWLIKIPGHFNIMLECYSPPALVVLAHWAALLVKRLENRGVWFLRGLTDRTLRQVAERIPPLETGIHNMIEGLCCDQWRG